jgi:hypothetical protein
MSNDVMGVAMGNDRSHNATNATYPFHEAIDRISQVQSLEELELYAGVITEERRYYNLFHLRMIAEALRFMRDEFR